MILLSWPQYFFLDIIVSYLWTSVAVGREAVPVLCLSLVPNCLMFVFYCYTLCCLSQPFARLLSLEEFQSQLLAAIDRVVVYWGIKAAPAMGPGLDTAVFVFYVILETFPIVLINVHRTCP